MNELTDFEKRIYNVYLATLGKANGRAFRHRKNFDKLKDEDYVALKKLGVFFGSNQSVNVDDYFAAPFKVYHDDRYQPLSFYNSPRAIKCYTTFVTSREKSNPDTPEITQFTFAGLKFILDYCIENKLTLNEYKQKRSDNDIPLILVHLKEHKVNFYVVHALELQAELYKLGVDWLNFYVSNFEDIFKVTRSKFLLSTTLKPKLKQLIEAIDRKTTTEKDKNELDV